jgi:hypothetical protein
MYLSKSEWKFCVCGEGGGGGSLAGKGTAKGR